jgi:hypothetical protein
MKRHESRKQTMIFVLTIELGNEEMQTPDNVADALKSVIMRLSEQEKFEGGKIHDINGNTVGAYRVLEGK